MIATREGGHGVKARADGTRRTLAAMGGLLIAAAVALLALMVLETAWFTVIAIFFLLPNWPQSAFDPVHFYVYFSLLMIGAGWAMRYVAPALVPGKRPVDELAGRTELQRRLRAVAVGAVALAIGVAAVLGVRCGLFAMMARHYERRLDREAPTPVPLGASAEWVAKARDRTFHLAALREKYLAAAAHPWRPVPPDPPEPE